VDRKFKIKSDYQPTGDQPKAIAELSRLVESGNQYQTLLGVTGSGKTFTMANIIEKVQRPALVISHNKTLAAQLYQEFKEFFPENEVHYFVSYYDYYQPEAYIPHTDTYIEKDAKINQFIDGLRHAATQAVLTRKDVIVVASVSCIYGLADPSEYMSMSLKVKAGENYKRQDFLRGLATLQYERNDIDPAPGTFSVKGEVIEVASPSGSSATHVEFFGDQIDRINDGRDKEFIFFPAKHFVTPQQKIDKAIHNIKNELRDQLSYLESVGKVFEADRLKQKTMFDLEMLKNTGYCSGIENYSRQIAFRKPGEPPFTMIDYMPKDFITFIDESHISLPQIRGMYHGDQARKTTLIEHGFRLPSAIDNRPLKFEEFEKRSTQTVYVSATPGPYEISKGNVVEQLIRPTGLLDPEIEVRPAKNQIKDLLGELQKLKDKKERALVTTVSKRLAEDISEYFQEQGIKAEYLHSEIKTLERPELVAKLRKGDFDVLVGINLLREGLDIPEVSLVAILDADKEGFLRNATTLIQTMGRAARHVNGHVLMYADRITDSMKAAIDATNYRRNMQESYNKEHGITPHAVSKKMHEWFHMPSKDESIENEVMLLKDKRSTIELKKELEEKMIAAAAQLDFETAAKYRDLLKELSETSGR
jgi:excinuclease ABC subunit B